MLLTPLTIKQPTRQAPFGQTDRHPRWNITPEVVGKTNVARPILLKRGRKNRRRDQDRLSWNEMQMTPRIFLLRNIEAATRKTYMVENITLSFN
jgi:hypothetical protein